MKGLCWLFKHRISLSTSYNIQARCYVIQNSPWHKEYLEQMWMRRQIVGPEAPEPRSNKRNWNYDAEIFAFGCRLKENFQMDTLKRAFLFPTKLEQDLKTSYKDAKEASVSVDLKHNATFITRGKEIVDVFTKAFLRYYYPAIPEEGILAISNELCSMKRLDELSRDIGTTDLIQSLEFPILPKTSSDAFYSIVGALEHDKDIQSAERFVQDFILTQLNEIDVNEIFNIDQPKMVVENFLKAYNKGEPESRLIRQAGSFTVTPIYIVGIYSDKKLLGQAPGESIQIATEMAYRDCLKNFFKTGSECRQVYNFSKYENIDEWKTRSNPSLQQIMAGKVEIVDAVEPEPLKSQKIVDLYKNTIERSLGIVHRRRLKHEFYKGTFSRRVNRHFIKPKVETI